MKNKEQFIVGMIGGMSIETLNNTTYEKFMFAISNLRFTPAMRGGYSTTSKNALHFLFTTCNN